jgi:hypothetical protein
MNGWISVRVAERREEAEGIVGLVLAPLPGASLPPYEPGAHIDLKMPNGMIRQYSLCGRVGDTMVYELGILLETAGRGGSRHVHEESRWATCWKSARRAISLPWCQESPRCCLPAASASPRSSPWPIIWRAAAVLCPALLRQNARAPRSANASRTRTRPTTCITISTMRRRG